MIPLYSAGQVRKADEYAIKKLEIPSIVLMENASFSVYKSILNNIEELDNSYTIGILCGKGNNGGDGFALARHFINDGYSVKILSFASQKDLSGNALTNYKIVKNLLKTYKSSKIYTYQKKADVNKLKDSYIIIDAMLGTGAKGNLREPYRSAAEKINEFDTIRIAVDVPSGLDLNTSSGDVIFRAAFTVTLGNYKNGLFYGKGYVNAGIVEKGYIGIGGEYFDELTVSEYLVEPEDAFVGIPIKALDSHKYSAGKVLVVAGSGNLPGAACLTSNAALKAGAGASILAFPDSIKGVAQSKLDSAIVQSYEDNGKEYLSIENIAGLKKRLNWADVIAMGPGLGREEDTGKAVREIIKKYSGKNIVLDADAIFALGNNKYKKLNLKNTVFTPHHKEFADLIGKDLDEVENDLLKHGKNFVKETGAYLVLKGAPTIIFTPDGDALINSTGNPGMSTFGIGDVLTGVIAAFISAGENKEDSIISAVYLHSLTADLLYDELSELGITAEAVMNNFPKAVNFIEDTFVQSS